MSPVRSRKAADSPHEPVVVEVDTYVDREDLAPGAKTFVAAGDHVPAELLGYPRRAVQA